MTAPRMRRRAVVSPPHGDNSHPGVVRYFVDSAKIRSNTYGLAGCATLYSQFSEFGIAIYGIIVFAGRQDVPAREVPW